MGVLRTTSGNFPKTVFLLVNLWGWGDVSVTVGPLCSILLSTVFITLNYARQKGRTVPVTT